MQKWQLTANNLTTCINWMWHIVFDNMYNHCIQLLCNAGSQKSMNCTQVSRIIFFYIYFLRAFIAMLLVEHSIICVCSLLSTLPFVYVPCWTLCHLCILLVEHSAICVCSLLNTLPFVYVPCWALCHLCMFLVEHSAICVCSLLNTLPFVYVPCWTLCHLSILLVETSLFVHALYLSLTYGRFHPELSGCITTLSVRNTGGCKLLCSNGHLDISRWNDSRTYNNFCSELDKLSWNKPGSVSHLCRKKCVNILITVILCNCIVFHICTVQIIMHRIPATVWIMKGKFCLTVWNPHNSDHTCSA